MNTKVIFLILAEGRMTSKHQALVKFGKKLRFIRKEQGLSQEELASRANLHRTYIGMIERGEKNITLINIFKISQALDVSASELLESVK